MVRVKQVRGAASGLLFLLAAAGCGGEVSVPNGDGGKGGTGTTTTGPGFCPQSAPASGAPCQGDLTCTYGTIECEQRFHCSSGHWEGDDVICAAPCPVDAPASGEPCFSPGQQCDYANPVCGDIGSQALCTSEGWVVTFSGPTCAPSCPAQPPLDGDVCDPCCEDTCTYPPSPGCPPVTATCTVEKKWSVPGPPCGMQDPCSTHQDEFTCAGDVACRWLVPGCGMNALPLSGCFSKVECIDNIDCPSGQICLTADVDPCWNMGCGACSATTQVCTFPPPP